MKTMKGIFEPLFLGFDRDFLFLRQHLSFSIFIIFTYAVLQRKIDKNDKKLEKGFFN